ncbi:YqaJ viral recombinase family nuclease [Wenjunlia vitaminophila]|uniref:YqaJ viral recombinase family nuclease n=1 Tax=Wenjunlia vitaminophila TaxID=76728 RepID=UPI0003780BB0|nr:YqaJ viral recombinase family protein [Wenjunlia vitaminophila]
MTTTLRAGATMAPAAGRRVTPTGRLILPADADRDLWLTARRSGIGSSDMAAILGLSRHGTIQTVYHDKRGNLPLDGEDSEPAYWGRANEDKVARRWAADNRSVIQRVGLVANEIRLWQMCTLDRRVMECPLTPGSREKCALEVKCRDKMKAPMWRKGCPDDVLAQVLWQIDVCGYDHLHVAVLLGGNDYRRFTVRRDEHEDVIADLRAAGQQVWDRIVAGDPPPVTGDEPPGPLLDLWEDLHPERAGVVHLDRDLEAQDALADYLDAVADEREAKARKKRLKAKLVERLGDADTAILGDRLAYSWDTSSTEHVDHARLREEFPDAYAACVSDRTARRLNIPRRLREEHTR